MSPNLKTLSIDTRFFGRPRRVSVPLYPSRSRFFVGNWAASSQHRLISVMSELYGVPESSLMLTGSGTQALFLVFKWLESRAEGECRVAMPAFCCPEVAVAAGAAGCTPVFLDLTEEMQFDERSLQYASNQNCRAILWPDIFAPRKRDVSLILLANRLRMIPILDDAQSFPGMYPLESYPLKKLVIRVFSFGPSKRLAGVGGGGVCTHHPGVAEEIRSLLKGQKPSRFRLLYDVRTIAGAMRYKIRRVIPAVSIVFQRFGLEPTDALSLAELHERRSPFYRSPCVFPRAITRLEAAVATQQLKHWTKRKKALQRNASLLCATIAECDDLGFRVMPFQGEAPTVFALIAESGSRYELGRFLVSHGIEATWYYFPLNRISAFSHCPSEETPRADNLSARILILPCQHVHSEREIRKVSEVLRSRQ